MTKIEISRGLINKIIKKRTKDVLDPAQEEQIKREINDLYDTITKKTKKFQRGVAQGVFGDEIGTAISNKFFKENQEKIKESVEKIEKYAEELSETKSEYEPSSNPKIKRKGSRLSRSRRKAGIIPDSDYTLEDIVEKETKNILDAEKAAKKEKEIRDKYFKAVKKTKPFKTGLLQGMFGDEVGAALARTLAKESPAEILKAREYFKNYGKNKQPNPIAEESLGAVVRTPTFDSSVNDPSVGVEIQKKKNDRLSALIGADETFEVKVVEVLGDLLKSVGKLERNTKADEYGSVHEKLRWIIENCCDKCCNPLGGLPVPIPSGRLPRIPVPTRVPGKIPVPTRVPTRVPTTIPTTTGTSLPAGAGAPTSIPATSTGKPSVAEPLRLTKQEAANFNKSVLQPEKATVTASQSRMEQMRRSAADAEYTPVEKVATKPTSVSEKYAPTPGQQPVKETLQKADDILKEIKSTPVQGELIPATSAKPSAGKQLTVTKTTSTVKPSVPQPGPGVGFAGGLAGGIGGTLLGFLGINSLRDKNLKYQDPKLLQQQAEAAKQQKLSEQETNNLKKQIENQKKDIKLRGASIIGGGAAGVAGGVAGAKFSPRMWAGFLKFLAVRSPSLYAKFGARLAAAGAGFAVPGPGWLWSAINVLGAAWAAVEIYGLIKEYNELPDEKRIEFEKEQGATPAASKTATTPSAPTAVAPIPKESSYQGTIIGFYAAAYKNEIATEEANFIKQGMNKSMARKAAEMKVKEKIIKGELPLKGGATISGVQKETTYDIDKRGPTSATPSDVLGLPGSRMSGGYDLDTRKPASGVPSDVLGLPGSQMSRDTNVIDRDRSAISAPKDSSYQGTISGFYPAAYKNEIAAEETRLIKQGMNKSMARRVAEMNVKALIIQGKLPLRGGATLSGVKTTGQSNSVVATPTPAASVSASTTSDGTAAIAPPKKVTPVQPEQGFFSKAGDVIAETAISVTDKVKSFFGFGEENGGKDDPMDADLGKYVKLKDASVNINGLNPQMKKRLAGMAKEYFDKTGQKIQINSGYRDSKEQAALYAKIGAPNAAPPGRSRHESGLAIDINSADANKAIELGLMAKYGFTRPVAGETWHVEPIESAKRGGTPDNPYAPGAPVVVANKGGKESTPATGTTPPATLTASEKTSAKTSSAESTSSASMTPASTGTTGDMVASTGGGSSDTSQKQSLVAPAGSSGTAAGRMAAARQRHEARLASGDSIKSSASQITPKQDSLGSTATKESAEYVSNQTQMAATPAPVVVNNNSGGGSSQPVTPPKQSMPKASTRSTENAFNRALAKDFSHPSAFTSVAPI